MNTKSTKVIGEITESYDDSHETVIEQPVQIQTTVNNIEYYYNTEYLVKVIVGITASLVAILVLMLIISAVRKVYSP